MAKSSPDLERLDADGVEAALPDLNADQLEVLVRRANVEYWERNDPSLPDPLYDRIVEALRRERPDSPLLDDLGERVPDGPVLEADEAEDVAPEARFGQAVRHTRPMLSLDKCYSNEELETWAGKFEGEIMAMPKMDGIAASLRYDERGKLQLAATRGRGTEGEDITVNVLLIEDVPNEIPAEHGPLEIRGEIFMPLSNFASFGGEFSNPRNLTAGPIKQKERDTPEGRRRLDALSFFAYDADGRDFAHERDKLAVIEACGFRRDGFDIEFVERDQLPASFERFAKVRPELDYEIDGVVFRAADTAEQRRLGSTSHHPRWSIAYKFQGDTGITTLNDVEWSVSRTGKITPVAMLEPIELSGAMISRASLHNLSRFAALGLRRRAKVEVTRRGGVIPMVERVIEIPDGAEEFEVPDHCPACGNEVVITRDREADFLQCKQPERCITARLGELEHFAKVVDIQGFGPKVVRKCFDEGFLSTPVDYYRLRVEDLEQLERLGRKSAQGLIDEVEAHREIPLSTFLQALGIAHLGGQTSRLLAQELGSLRAIREVDRERLLQIRGIQDAIADAIIEGLDTHAELIDALLSEVKIDETPVETIGNRLGEGGDGLLAGKSFLFTGALESFDRKTAQQKVLEHGGTTASGVSKTLDVLVIGSGKGQKSSKQKKAEKLIADGVAIEIMSEGDFLKLIGEDA